MELFMDRRPTDEFVCNKGRNQTTSFKRFNCIDQPSRKITGQSKSDHQQAKSFLPSPNAIPPFRSDRR
jgi:hypothetical protein